MRRLTAFLNLSLDGYFTDAHDDMSWAHKFDPEWMKFSSDNAQGSGDGALLFGRRTYEQMAAYWPTPQARQQLPGVADGINRLPKFVVSRTLDKATWNNTTLLEGDAVEHARKLKASGDAPIVILGSGTLIAALTQEQLIDQYT